MIQEVERGIGRKEGGRRGIRNEIPELHGTRDASLPGRGSRGPGSQSPFENQLSRARTKRQELWIMFLQEDYLQKMK